MYRINQIPTENDPLTGQKDPNAGGALPSTSASPSPGGIANVGAPLPTQATEPAGGGAVSTQQAGGGNQAAGAGPDLKKDRGSPVQYISQQTQSNPEQITDIAEQAQSRVKQTVENQDDNAESMQKLKQQLGITGESISQMQDTIYKSLEVANTTGRIDNKTHTGLKNRWKNIFNYIGEDEMGLFLIDFGLRAMMAGEGMGDLAAIGAAGSGALGALQGRRQAAVEDERARQQLAREGALDQYGAESQRMSAAGSLMSGQAAMQRADASQGYQGKDAFLLDYYRSLGMGEDEIRSRMLGGNSYEETYDIVADDVEKAYLDAVENAPVGNTTIGARPVKVGGKEMYWHQLSDPQVRAQLAAEITRERMRRRSQGMGGASGDGALPASQRTKSAQDYLNEPQ